MRQVGTYGPTYLLMYIIVLLHYRFFHDYIDDSNTYVQVQVIVIPMYIRNNMHIQGFTTDNEPDGNKNATKVTFSKLTWAIYLLHKCIHVKILIFCKCHVKVEAGAI